MEPHRVILKRVGWVLVAVGLADVGAMTYCVMNGIGYSSSLNIFAVAAGIFLLRGHLGAVRVVTWFAAFMLAGFLGLLLVSVPFLTPFDLWLTQLRLNELNTLMSLAFGAAVIGFVYWVYRQLRKPAVIQARVAAGQSASPPRLAFALGVLLVATLVVTMQLTLRGEAGERAKNLAEAQSGPGYKYSVSRVSWSGEHGRADVTVYNDHEIKSVDVQW